MKPVLLQNILYCKNLHVALYRTFLRLRVAEIISRCWYQDLHCRLGWLRLMSISLSASSQSLLLVVTVSRLWSYDVLLVSVNHNQMYSKPRIYKGKRLERDESLTRERWVKATTRSLYSRTFTYTLTSILFSLDSSFLLSLSLTHFLFPNYSEQQAYPKFEQLFK